MNTRNEYTADLELALRIADMADGVSLTKFRSSDLAVESKPDMTPVSEADREVESRARDLLATERPDDAVLGEEFGSSGTASRRWVIDPIDGTKNYVRGIPVFASLIALTIDGDAKVGVVSAPALGTRWWGTRGGGAFRNGDAISVSGVSRLEDAQVSFNDIRSFARHGRAEGIASVSERAWRMRGFGDFWSHVLVADGSADVSVEPIVNSWDLAALQVIVEEAGGRFTDLDGNRGYEGGSVLATNGLLHDEILALFSQDS